jgi:hypothetical protein
MLDLARLPNFAGLETSNNSDNFSGSGNPAAQEGSMGYTADDFLSSFPLDFGTGEPLGRIPLNAQLALFLNLTLMVDNTAEVPRSRYRGFMISMSGIMIRWLLTFP